MQLHLVFILFVLYHQFIFAYSTKNNYTYVNQNKTSINIDLYQCDTNITIFNGSTNTIDARFNNLMNSCNINCCTSNRTNSSKTCQITVQSSTGICLGRICYLDECDNFVLLSNMTRDYEINNKTTVMNKIHSSSSYIPWSSLVNSTRTKWNLWVDKTGLTIRHTILVILLIASISLTFMTLIIVIKSIRYANILADRKSYRYTLL